MGFLIGLFGGVKAGGARAGAGKKAKPKLFAGQPNQQQVSLQALLGQRAPLRSPAPAGVPGNVACDGARGGSIVFVLWRTCACARARAHARARVLSGMVYHF